MDRYFILPNREQRDEILASDGWKTFPLRKVLAPEARPEGFAHGVPTELLEKCGASGYSQILFGQKFPAWDRDRQLFTVLTTAGADSSGRVAHIGLLFILKKNEVPDFNVPCSGLLESDRIYALALVHRLTTIRRQDLWARSIHDLSLIPSDLGPATNVELERSLVHFFSLYTLGSHGLRKGLRPSIKAGIAIITFMTLLLLGVLLLGLTTESCPARLRRAVARDSGERMNHGLSTATQGIALYRDQALHQR